MLKRAIMAGLNAGGVNVDDLEVAPVPVTRFQVRSQRSQGGISVRLLAGDSQSVVMRFFDDGGADISEAAARKIERNFYREDYRRVFPGDIGDIGFPARTLEHYTEDLMSAIDVRAVRGASFRVVVDYSCGSGAFVMPNVLSKLGAEVLAVNPFASTPGALAFDRDAQVENVASLVRTSNAQLGVVLDPDVEHLALIDDEGRALTDVEALLAFVSLLGATADGPCRIAVPVVVPTPVVSLAEDLGIEVIQTKLAPSALMGAETDDEIAMAGSIDGAFAFPRFLAAFDAIAAFVMLLELLARTGSRLSKIAATLPSVHVLHDTVVTPSEQKGTVMRGLVETTDGELELVDGVKVRYDDGWVLALPDPELSLTHLWAEGPTDEAAAERLAEHAERVRGLLRSSATPPLT
jgi:mannose-1-phosphate guanylyltransferase / phosphomannomutase